MDEYQFVEDEGHELMVHGTEEGRTIRLTLFGASADFPVRDHHDWKIRFLTEYVVSAYPF